MFLMDFILNNIRMYLIKHYTGQGLGILGGYLKNFRTSSFK